MRWVDALVYVREVKRKCLFAGVCDAVYTNDATVLLFGVAVVVRPVSAVARSAEQAQRRSTERRVRVIRLKWCAGPGVLGTAITEGLTDDWRGTVGIGLE